MKLVHVADGSLHIEIDGILRAWHDPFFAAFELGDDRGKINRRTFALDLAAIEQFGIANLFGVAIGPMKTLILA